jgi:uncharacterized protein
MERESFSCNLSARLFSSSRLYERQIEQHWLLFAPDRPGLPVLVEPWTHKLLHSFTCGATVGEILSRYLTTSSQSFEDFICAIGFLEERGFLRSQQDPDNYSVSKDAYDVPAKQASVWLHINNACNLGCDYCFVQNQSNQVMSPEVLRLSVRRIAETVSSNNISELVLKMAGGEPTLAVGLMESAYDQLTKALDGSKTTLQVVVLSNGTTVNDRIIEFLRRPGVGMGISVDGFRGAHDVHRTYKYSKKGTWDVIARNITHLIGNGIKPHIMTTLTKESCPGLTELAGWIFSQGLATRLNVVRPPHPPSYSRAQRLNDYTDLAAACTRAFAELFSTIERWKTPVNIAQQLHICELSFEYPLNGPACGMGRSHIVMDHHGNLADCVMAVHAAKTAAGSNLLSDVRNTTQYVPYSRESVTNQDVCCACQWFPVCGGGCPTANTAVNGHPYTQSPLCEFFRYVIPRYLECFGKWMLTNEKKVGVGTS